MRLISCSQITDGVELARDILVGPPGTAPLLRAGVKLSARCRTALPKAGVGPVWIEDSLGEGVVVADPLRPETRARMHRATGGGALRGRPGPEGGAGMPVGVLRSLTDVAEGMVADLMACPGAAVALDDLSAFDSYKAAAPPHVGVRVIVAGAGTQFCPDVVRHFRTVVFPYPVGHEITLPDRRVGVVASVDPADPDRPLVRVAEGDAVSEVAVDMAAAPPLAAA
jgi:hypothetical protein